MSIRPFTGETLNHPPLLSQLETTSQRQGERGLWGAVLLDCIACVQKRARLDNGERTIPGRADAIYAQARAWIAADDEAPASFAWVCHVLGMEPVSTRRTIQGLGRVSVRAHHGNDRAMVRGEYATIPTRRIA